MTVALWVQLNTRIPPELDERIERTAAAASVRKADLVIAILEDGLMIAESLVGVA